MTETAPRIIRPAAIAAALAASLLVCLPAQTKRKQKVPPELLELVERVSTGRSNFFMRSSFDTDPSPYLGRFVPEGALDLDDAMAMQTACGEHITYREIDAGGVQYDEYFNASTSVSAGLGLPLLSSLGAGGSVGFGYKGGSIVRVQYTLTRKMVATLEDPEAFAACCEEGAGRCTGLYLGEFLEGSGKVMHFTADQKGLKASGGAKGVEVGVEVKDGVQWQRSVTFDNPVFFAFKTTAVPPDLYKACEPCGDWTSQIPRSNRGEYFVGLSDILDSERIARSQAQRDARIQVVRYLGESIQAGSIEVLSTTGDASDLTSRLDQNEFVETAAAGVAELVKDRCWCIEEHETPGGVRFEAKVLAFLPAAEEEEAVAELMDEVEPAEDGGEQVATDADVPEEEAPDDEAPRGENLRETVSGSR